MQKKEKSCCQQVKAMWVNDFITQMEYAYAARSGDQPDGHASRIRTRVEKTGGVCAFYRRKITKR